MDTITGIFVSHTDGERAYQRLREQGFKGDDLTLLTPYASQADLESVPTEDAEQPGIGKAIGGLAGGAVGLAAGALLAQLFLPGVGMIVAAGLGAGSVGAVAGASGGEALESMLIKGLPKDEIFFYEEALKQGRTVVVALSKNKKQTESARKLMKNNGAESLDAARERWWIGIRDQEALEFPVPGAHLDQNQYRRGFEAAQEPGLRDKPFSRAKVILQQRFPDVFEQEAFQLGYTTGHKYASRLRPPSSQAEGQQEDARG